MFPSSLQRDVRLGLMTVAIASGCAAQLALAGPTWDVDYTNDALQTATTAQIVSASLSPYINIFGRLSGYGFTGPSDFVDMYQISIDTQTMVSISTAGGSLGGNTTFDSQLFIFKRKGGNGNRVRAVALHGNNDAAVGNQGSRIGDEFDSSSNYTVLAPGFYYLAIAGVGSNAIADDGSLVWPDLDIAGSTVFGNERILDDWGGEGAVGEYHIKLHAVNGFVPSPGAIALLGIAGLVKRRRR
jgi:hypothetical protein